MTQEEAILLSAYTGFLLAPDFADVHKFCEKTLGRPIFTHEFADPKVQREIQEKLRPKILETIQNISHLRPVSRDQTALLSQAEIAEQDADEIRANWHKSCELIRQQRKELERRDKIINDLDAELMQMSACAYYRAGGLCRYGAEDPANNCVFGPCPHELSTEDVFAELKRVKAERDTAIETIFQWVGCPECKHWNAAEEWCEKYDREAGSCSGCDSPEWCGLRAGENGGDKQCG